MKKRILVLMIGFLLIAVNLYAAAGDLIVEGNVGIGTNAPNSLIEVQRNSIGISQDESYGISLVNTTAATAGNQQYSPPLRFRAQGWELATPASKTVEWMVYAKPVQPAGQGRANPHSQLVIASSINNAAYNEVINIQRDGNDDSTTYNFIGNSPMFQIAATNGTNANFGMTANSVNTFTQLTYSNSSYNRFYGSRARGTSASPAAVQLNDIFYSIEGGGWYLEEGDVYASVGGKMQFAASQDWTNTANGTRISFYTMPNNTTYPTIERLRIDHNGNVGIGTTTPSYKLDVAGTVNASGGYTQVSDVKFKKDITSIESPLEKIAGIKGVSYSWNTAEYKDRGFTEGKHYGVIGQEVEKVLPEIVKEGLNGEKSVSYTEIIPVLIEAVKEQQKIIEELKTEVQRLKAKDFISKVQ